MLKWLLQVLLSDLKQSLDRVANKKKQYKLETLEVKNMALES